MGKLFNFFSFCFLICKMAASILSTYKTVLSINWETDFVPGTTISSNSFFFPLSLPVSYLPQPPLQLDVAIRVWMEVIMCITHQCLSLSICWRKELVGSKDRSHEMEFAWIPKWPCGIDHLLKRNIHIKICMNKI